MNRIENAGQVKTGYSVKSGTNSEEKVGNGSDFASMLTKYKKKAAHTTNARTIIWHQFCFLLFFKLLKVLLDTELGVS